MSGSLTLPGSEGKNSFLGKYKLNQMSLILKRGYGDFLGVHPVLLVSP